MNQRPLSELPVSESEIRRQCFWNSLHTFENPTDIPELPIVDSDIWNNFYVPRLIQLGAISKNNMVIGQCYIGRHRRANVARWLGDRFVYRRYKWGSFYDDYCNHFEDDNGFALFVPLKLGTDAQWIQNKE